MTIRQIILAVALMFVSCSKNGTDGTTAASIDTDGRKIVVTSFYPIHIAALNVIGDVEGIRLMNLSPQQAGCAHDYQLTPADAALIEKASALIVNGGGMETFLDRAAAVNGNMSIIDASADIISGFGYISGATASHAWMNIGDHIRQIAAIAEGMAALDAENAVSYRENARVYAAHLTVLKEWAMTERMRFGNIKVALAHDGFSGFVDELGLITAAIIEKTHGSEPGAAEIAAAIDAVRNERPAAILTELDKPSAAAVAVALETGVPVFELEMITSGPVENDAYIRAVERNVETLKKALK